jgi:hypothetical protein
MATVCAGAKQHDEKAQEGSKGREPASQLWRKVALRLQAREAGKRGESVTSEVLAWESVATRISRDLETLI